MRVIAAAVLVLLASACSGGGDGDGDRVARFRELAEARGLELGGLDSGGDVVEYAEGVCDDLDPESEAFYLAALADSDQDVAHGAASHATAVDAFCPGERSDLEEGVASYEVSAGHDLDLPEAP